MKKFSFIIVFFILILGGILAWWINSTTAANPADKTQKAFSIKKGEGVKTVANNLKSQGLIKDPVIFYLVVRGLGIDSKIQAGDFFLSPSMSASEIAKTLQTSTSDVRVVIPEGMRAEEITDVLKERVDSYDESWRANLVLHEGYLFPDTYSFSKDVTINQIISTMRDNFEKKYQKIENGESSKLSKEEIVIVASMVEREARHDQDRPLVASVILNRYKIGMKLDIDSTIQYALGYQAREKRWWKKRLLLRDLELNSPYNTYRVAGLPPRPISNPGFESLSAVVNPTDTNYFYYLSDSAGNNHYAKTNAEHEANKRKYGL